MPETKKATEHGEKDKGHEGEHGEGHEGKHGAGGEEAGKTTSDPQEIARRANERNGAAARKTAGLSVPGEIGDGEPKERKKKKKKSDDNSEESEGHYGPFTETMRRDAAAFGAHDPLSNHAQAVRSGTSVPMHEFTPAPQNLQAVDDASNQVTTSASSSSTYSPKGLIGNVPAPIGYFESEAIGQMIAQENAPAQPPVNAAGTNQVVVHVYGQGAGGGGGGAGHQNANPPGVDRCSKACKIIGWTSVATVVGGGLFTGGYFGGKALGWWGTEPAMPGPEVGPISKMQAARSGDDWATVTFAAGLDATQKDAEASSPLKLDSFRFFKSEVEAMNPDNEGSKTLKVDGGTWSFAVNAGKTDVDLTFTPDGSEDGVPVLVYYKIKNEALIRSKLQSITLTYEPKPKVVQPTTTPPSIKDVPITEQIYDQPFSLDLASYLTKGTNDIAFETLELVTEDGAGTAEIPLPDGTGTWRATASISAAKVEFTPKTNFRGEALSVKFRIYDVAKQVSNTATLTVSFLLPPMVANQLIGVSDLSAGKSHTFDVLASAEKGTNDIDTSSLVLIGTVKVNPNEADAVFDPSDKVFDAKKEVRGYTKITVPRKGVWEVVQVGGKAQLRFTVGSSDIDEAGIVQFSVADVKGYESPQAKVHLAKDYITLAQAIAGMMDKDDAAFWADFKTKVVDPKDEDVPLEVMRDVIKELSAASSAQAAAQKQTPMDQPNLKNIGGAPTVAVRTGWNNSGDKASLFNLTMQNIDYAATGDAPAFQTRSYWNRDRRLVIMTRMINEYFAMLRDMMS